MPNVPLEIPLWTGNPPDMVEGATPGADDGTGRWRNVGIPGMLVYLPETPAPEGGRMALIACPGGKLDRCRPARLHHRFRRQRSLLASSSL